MSFRSHCEYRADDSFRRGRLFLTASNGRPALRLIDARTREPVATAIVNLPHLSLPPHLVVIKDWSENAGIRAALEAAGVIRSTGMFVRAGMVEAPVCRLMPAEVEEVA